MRLAFALAVAVVSTSAFAESSAAPATPAPLPLVEDQRPALIPAPARLEEAPALEGSSPVAPIAPAADQGAEAAPSLVELQRVELELESVKRDMTLLGTQPPRLSLVPLVLGWLVLGPCLGYVVGLPVGAGLIAVLFGANYFAFVAAGIISLAISIWPALVVGGALVVVGAVLRWALTRDWRASRDQLNERRAALEAERAAIKTGLKASVDSSQPLFAISF